MRITHRRICWPEPGLVCLQGGCAYCNESPLQPLIIIEASLVTEEEWAAHRYGRDHAFFNAVTRSQK